MCRQGFCSKRLCHRYPYPFSCVSSFHSLVCEFQRTNVECNVIKLKQNITYGVRFEYIKGSRRGETQ